MRIRFDICIVFGNDRPKPADTDDTRPAVGTYHHAKTDTPGPSRKRRPAGFHTPEEQP